VHVIWEDQNGL
jgi:hypothetical protein